MKQITGVLKHISGSKNLNGDIKPTEVLAYTIEDAVLFHIGIDSESS